MLPRLQEKYENEVVSGLKESFGRTNRLALPRIEKIVVNMGVGTAVQEKKHIDDAVSALTEITGQKPIITIARKSVAGFRLREGMPIGTKVTLPPHLPTPGNHSVVRLGSQLNFETVG